MMLQDKIAPVLLMASSSTVNSITHAMAAKTMAVSALIKSQQRVFSFHSLTENGFAL